MNEGSAYTGTQQQQLTAAAEQQLYSVQWTPSYTRGKLKSRGNIHPQSTFCSCLTSELLSMLINKPPYSCKETHVCFTVWQVTWPITRKNEKYLSMEQIRTPYVSTQLPKPTSNVVYNKHIHLKKGSPFFCRLVSLAKLGKKSFYW